MQFTRGDLVDLPSLGRAPAIVLSGNMENQGKKTELPSDVVKSE